MIKSKNANNTVTAKMYDTLVRPVITEKSMISSEAGKVTFMVPLSASKDEVSVLTIKKPLLRLPKVKILMLQQDYKPWH